MSDLLTPDADLEQLLTVTTSRSRRVRNKLATVWMYLSFVVVGVPLVIVVGYVVVRGIRAIDAAWFTNNIMVVDTLKGGGMAPAIVGTLVITFWASLMAVPLGAQGLIGFGGSLALACLMLPIVIRSSEEMLRLVPDDLRQASYALGNRKWRTILTVVLPAALGGMVSGIMLAVARAAGETAPLLFTIGAAHKINWNAFKGPNTALSMQIWHDAQSPYAASQDRAWGAALTLIVLVFVLTFIARIISSRFSLKHH